MLISSRDEACLLVRCRYDGSNTTNLLSMLDVDTFYWDTWDGNLVRTGAATALVEGKLFVVGGDDMGDKYSELYQYNMGGFMMQFDGVDDEIMIPHLPTIIPLQYTIEAWVKPARVGPMNIVARSDETHPMVRRGPYRSCPPSFTTYGLASFLTPWV